MKTHARWGERGGYKMAATGLTTWRSIRCHHCPETMHRADFLPASMHSRMRRQFDSIGRAMERGIGKRFFAVDAVLGTHAQARAERYVGKNPRILVMPEAFRHVGVHLYPVEAKTL